MLKLISLFAQLLSVAATAVAATTTVPEPLSCPDIQVCDETSCRVRSADPAQQYAQVLGVRVPMTRTNFPLINAGLYFLQRHQSDLFLAEALKLICAPDTTVVNCDNPVVSGQLPDALAGFDVFDIWAAVGAAQASVGESPSSFQIRRCREYERLAQTGKMALLPDIALQSNPYAEEGIRIRTNIAKLVTAKKTIFAGCRATETLQTPATAAGNYCVDIQQYLDDLMFALLLSDKLSTDAQTTRARELIRSCERSVSLTSAAAATTEQTGRDSGQAYHNSVILLLGEPWTELRAAIQKAL